VSSETAQDTDDSILIDVRGLKCPLPVLKTARRMQPHPKGSRFLVRATDPLAAVDVPHFCSEQGHQLLASGKDGPELYFRIEKG
jgi:tRNA 2-thiouridine synthesizing protein A